MIVGDAFGFPNGYGATARVYAYAKGLSENGVSVHVICFKTSERAESGIANTETQGVYDGIPFEYACGTTVRANTFWLRRWLEIKGAWRFWRLMREMKQHEKIDAIILFSNSVSWIILTVILTKLIGAKCIQEKSEFPFVYHKKTPWLKLYASIYICTIYRLFDGIIVISTYLRDYFLGRIRKKAKILRVPILVDIPPMNSIKKRFSNTNKQIVYMGNLSHLHELSSLIQTFAMLADKYPNWTLLIIGGASGVDIPNLLKELVDDLHLNSRVVFTGQVRRDEIPRYLSCADFFVLPRSLGIFSQAGFPTKVGEYLATGKPVVVTTTGDIPLYLKDGVNAYLVPPNDNEAFAEKLEYVISHPEVSKRVGLKGRTTAQKYFAYKTQTSRIISYIDNLDRNVRNFD
jgi:glycosyltransferase involved in cell wall biosynthesis